MSTATGVACTSISTSAGSGATTTLPAPDGVTVGASEGVGAGATETVVVGGGRGATDCVAAVSLPGHLGARPNAIATPPIRASTATPTTRARLLLRGGMSALA